MAKEFNQINGLELVYRAHQMAMDGYQYFFDKAVCTVGEEVWSDAKVWSAPNYCYRSGNLASILQLSETLERHFEVFKEEDPDKRTYPADQPVRYLL